MNRPQHPAAEAYDLARWEAEQEQSRRDLYALGHSDEPDSAAPVRGLFAVGAFWLLILAAAAVGVLIEPLTGIGRYLT